MNYHPHEEPVALFEHRFWLQVLGDHARFIFNNLAPKETAEIDKACNYICIFDQLLEQSRQITAMKEIRDLTEESFEHVEMLKGFKLHLLKRHILGNVDFHLPPTLLNHMLNELDEYLRILEGLQCGYEVPQMHSIHHDLLWLQDAVGHTLTLASSLDPVEKDLIEKSQAFTKQFRDLHEKALEFEGYLRTGVTEFPALARLNFQVDKKINAFREFLCQLRESVSDKEVLGTLVPLIPDHMLREECYFLIKLAEVSNIKAPNCDPTRPRI